jgi:hypothetical protein
MRKGTKKLAAIFRRPVLPSFLHPPTHNKDNEAVGYDGEKVARFGILEDDLGEHEQMAITQQPTTNNQQPTTNNQQPTTNNQRPTTNNQQPTTNNQ